MISIENEYRGFLLSLLIGLLSFGATVVFPGYVSSIILALFVGMIVGNVVPIPHNFQSGIKFTSGKLLELSILFLAFSINYTHIAEIGGAVFGVIAGMVIFILLLTVYLAKKMKCPGSTGWLVGFGTAICGSSAIAALAPTVTKNKEDVGIALAVVNLLGSIGMIAIPFILLKFNMSTNEMGYLIGGSLHSVGNVAGSAYAVNDVVGEAAITVKLARVAMLSPGLILFNFLLNRGEATNWKQHFKLPWYLWLFIGITILTSLVDMPAEFLKFMHTGGKIILTIAMAAIGLKISFNKLFKAGKRGIIFGSIIFAAQLVYLLFFALIMDFS